MFFGKKKAIKELEERAAKVDQATLDSHLRRKELFEEFMDDFKRKGEKCATFSRHSTPH